MNYGDGLYGGMFFGGMYAAAFFETDPRKVVEAGLRVDPGRQRLRDRSSRDVLKWSAAEPEGLAEDLAPHQGEVGQATIRAPTARSTPSTSTRS